MALPDFISTTPAPSGVEQRRQAALAVAQTCTEILQQDFGATEVIVFGSLRGDTPWHAESDLDLAVKGLAADQVVAAWERLARVVPPWLPFDLVAIEQADARVRDRILQLTPMPNNPYLALKLRLEDELSLIQRTVTALETALVQAKDVAEIFVTPTLASFIADFYSGCERLAERVALGLDGRLPQGANWHAQRLDQMAMAGSEGRPPLWDATLLATLHEYRRFRHRARHLYSVSLDGERVLALAQQVPEVFGRVQVAIAQFSLWLTQQAH